MKQTPFAHLTFLVFFVMIFSLNICIANDTFQDLNSLCFFNITAVDPGDGSPGSFKFVNDSTINQSNTLKAYPNPFRNFLTIDYKLEHAGQVLLSVFDAQGQLVKVLEDDWVEAGPNRARWNTLRPTIDPGIYLLKLETEKDTRTQRVVLVQ